jgi:acyl-CoA thioesterase-1
MARVAARKAGAPASSSRRAVACVGGLLLAVLAGAWYLQDRDPDVRGLANLEAPGELVVFLGDSITQGYGVTEAEAFPALAAGALGVPFMNAGVSGDTTAGGLARLDRDVLARAPRLAVVELGGNDFLRRVPVEDTLRNLETITKRLVGAGTMVALLHVNVGAGLVADPYLDGYRALARRHGALLVEDALEGVLTDRSLRLDAIHPNAAGHRCVAARVAAALGTLLRESDKRKNLPARTGFLLPDRGVMDRLES